MITSEELLECWHNRNNTITIADVTLNEAEVMYTATVLGALTPQDTEALRTREVLGRCKACYRSHVTFLVCANSIKILNDTYKEIL